MDTLTIKEASSIHIIHYLMFNGERVKNGHIIWFENFITKHDIRKT